MTVLMERRTAGRAPEIRDGAEGAPMFYGHAGLYNTRTTIGNPLTWGFFEEITRDAYVGAMGAPGYDPRFLIDHDTSLIVARQSSGDLRTSVDDTGWVFDSDLTADRDYVQNLIANVRARRWTGMSIGFVCLSADWTTVDVEATDENGKTFTVAADLRTITGMELWEGSVVTFPAYDETDAALRGLAGSSEALSRRAALLKQSEDKTVIGRALDLLTEVREGKQLVQENRDALAAALNAATRHTQPALRPDYRRIAAQRGVHL